MFRLPYLVLCLVAVSHQFTITKFEVPGAVELGGNATLLCEHDARAPRYAKWWWEAADRSRRLLYQRFDDGEPSISHNNTLDLNITLQSEGLDNIQLWDLNPEHSGTFICEVVENQVNETRRDDHLLVYTTGSGPLLNMTKAEDTKLVQVTCEALEVAPVPVATIDINSKQLNCTSSLHGPVDGLYNVSASASLPEAELEGLEVTCNLLFNDIAGVKSYTSDIYYSDAWEATTAAPTAPDDATEAQAPLEAPVTSPGRGSRAGASWLLLAALAAQGYALL